MSMKMLDGAVSTIVDVSSKGVLYPWAEERLVNNLPWQHQVKSVQNVTFVKASQSLS
jgi:predicted naringenin-chalcone synthase